MVIYGNSKYGSAGLEVEGENLYLQEKEGWAGNIIWFQRTRTVEMSYVEVSCLTNAGFVVLQDHLLLGNYAVEEF